jgi:sugar phosphate permease
MNPGIASALETQATAGAASGKKTNVRWLVLVLLCLMYLVTYIDRACISVVAPVISKEFGFSKLQMGLIFSAFAWAYSLGQIPGGWLGDRFGPRRVLPSMVLFWSAMTMATAWGFSFVSFLVIRFIFGLGEAGANPTSTRAVQHWYPKSERGVVSGLMHSFVNFSTSLVPPVVVVIMQAWGWRSVFYLFGMVGVLWAITYWLVYRDRPEQHSGVNEVELAHIRERSADGTVNVVKEEAKTQVPWGIILRSPNTWFLSAAWACYVYNAYFFFFWLPSYLVEHHHVSMQKMGFLAALPLFAGGLGGVAGGALTDFFYKRTGNLRNARRYVCIMSMLGSAAFLAPSALLQNPVAVSWCMAGTVFFLATVMGPTWAVAMDIGKDCSGSVSGVMNMVGNSAGAVSPIVFGYLAERGMWIAPFAIAIGVLLAGVFIWIFLVNPERSVVERAQPAL